MSIIKNIRFFSSEVPPVIEVAQGSSALEIVFNSLDLPILSTDSVRIYVKKPSGLEVYNSCVIQDDLTIKAKTTTQMTAEAGRAECQLNVTQADSEVANSAIFYLDVMKTIIDGSAIESTSEYTALQELINDTAAAIENCEDAAETALGAVDNYIAPATYAYSSGVHTLTLAADYQTANVIRFIPTHSWEEGDTLRIKRGSASAISVDAFTVSGDDLPTGAWVVGSALMCMINSGGAYFMLPGPIETEPRSTATQVLQGTSQVVLDKVGSCVHAYFTLPGAWSAGKTVLQNTIPSGYRPAQVVYSGFHRALSGDSLSTNGMQMSVGTDGVVTLRATDSVANTWTYHVTLSWDVPAS